MSFSPIVLFCYQRTDTLKLCIESLKECPEIKNTDLLIFSDAPANDSVKEKVMEVRQFIREIDGFKSVEIIERTINLGVDYNIITGLKEASERFDEFIIIEDDIVVKPDCLKFFNSALSFYKDNSRIISISAFSYVNKIPLVYYYDGYFTGRHNPWGWATWSDRIKQVDWEMEDKKSFQDSKILQREFNKWGSDMSSMLINTINGKIRAWDIRLDYHIFKNDYVVFFPIKSLSNNIGFGRDDSSNTFGYNRFKIKLDSTIKSTFSFPANIFLDEIICKQFINKNSLFQRLFTRLMKAIGYIN